MSEIVQQRFIGDFGVEHDDFQEITFGWFGETIRVNPDSGELAYLEFMVEALKVDEDNQAEGIRVTHDFLKQQIHPEDWDKFWGIAKAKRQSLETLMAVSKSIVEATAGFPTTQPSDSSPGQQPTAPKSKAASSKPATARAIENVTPIDSVRTPEEILKGRPDLQRAVALAQGAA